MTVYEINLNVVVLVCCSYAAGMLFSVTNRSSFIRGFIFFAYLTILILYAVIVDQVINSSSKMPYILTGLIWTIVGFLSGRKGKNYLLTLGWYAFIFTLCAATLGTAIGQINHDFIAYQFKLPFGFNGTTENFKITMAAHLFPASLALVLIWPFYSAYRRDVTRVVLKKVIGIATFWGLLRFVIQYFESWLQKNALWWIPGEQVPIEYEIFMSYSIGLLVTYPALGYSFKRFTPRAGKNHSLNGIYESQEIGLQKAIERLNKKDVIRSEHEFELKEGISYKVGLPEGWSQSEQKKKNNRITQSFYPPINVPARLFLYLDSFAPDKVKELCKDAINNGSDHPIFDPKRYSELLGRTATSNLIKKDARIESEQYDILPGIPSYECTFKRPVKILGISLFGMLYFSGYVANFIFEDWEFTFYWEADFKVFDEYLHEVKRIVRGTTLILDTGEVLT